MLCLSVKVSSAQGGIVGGATKGGRSPSFKQSDMRHNV